MYVGAPMDSRVLIFDPTDKTAQFVGRSRRHPDEPAISIQTSHLFGHYYLEQLTTEPEKQLDWKHL